MPDRLSSTARAAGSDRPLVSILLMAFNQQETIRAAIDGALAQTYTPLEIVVSDDASTDGTWHEIEAATAGYRGPHALVVQRNPSNLGIGAHLSRLVSISRGELLVVAAGDDVSMPQRCDRVTQVWLGSNRQVDLIASAVTDIDASGSAQAEITPSDLASYRSLADWAARPPHVIGAAQAWTRRVFERFGPLPQGVVAEDLIMAFRAIGCGGAVTLPEALVQYRRGGLSYRVRSMHASDVIARVLSNNRHALIEVQQLQRDATHLDASPAIQVELNATLARERFIAELFEQRSFVARGRTVLKHRAVSRALRLRLWVYAAAPWALAPWFALKRLAARVR